MEPLLPPWPERSSGPKPVDDRLCLQGIMYVLHQDTAWQLLPLTMGFGSGRTCWRRLDSWQKASISQQLHRILLALPNEAGELDWPRACVDGSHIRVTQREPQRAHRRSTSGRRAANTT
ncbi:transposase [Streptomyces sp. NPDC046716]|uniref:transposase n=1 Tax=Streptomyces sp. NPDC046716 TaxID=3157093 RepID=UPI0033EB1A85